MARPLQNKFKTTNLISSQQGFTIIEILIALFLMVLVLGLGLSSQFSSNEDLDKEASSLERAIRFMNDEAVLRNSVVRLHFMLGNAPQEYAVEYGPSDSFILPPEPEFQTKSLTKEEEEKAKKQTKEINLKFNKVQEFQDSNTEISDNVKILGIGNSTSGKFQASGDASVYAFPTGEKDDAIIILADDVKVVSLEINPFNQKIEKKNHPYQVIGNRDSNDVLDEKAKEIFETWLRDRK